MSMSMHPYNNDGEEFRCDVFAWHQILELAVDAGWNQEGTYLPHGCAEGYWNAGGVWTTTERGGYENNQGNFVTSKDACNLAAALERLLTETSNEEIAAGSMPGSTATVIQSLETHGITVRPCMLAPAELGETIEQFMVFARASGGFWIW